MKRITLIFFATTFFTIISCNLISEPVHYLKYHYTNIKMEPNSKESSDTGINEMKISNETPLLISNQFLFTEGPAVDKHGNIFFTDQPNDRIWEYDTSGKLSVFMNHSGRSNGMYFDKHGNLITCADLHDQLWSVSRNKKVTVLLKNYKGEIFNGPNDVWVNPVNNGIYFTDPYYKRDYWKKDHPHIEAQRVYYLATNKQIPIIVDSALNKPNGLIGTPDGKYLYVADIGADKTYKYKINSDGSLIDKQRFVTKGSDGMTIDNNGNIYLTGKGVTVYNKEGNLIQQIPIPEAWTANVCIGGKNNDELFITASKSIYLLHLNVKGVQ